MAAVGAKGAKLAIAWGANGGENAHCGISTGSGTGSLLNGLRRGSMPVGGARSVLEPMASWLSVGAFDGCAKAAGSKATLMVEDSGIADCKCTNASLRARQLLWLCISSLFEC